MIDKINTLTAVEAIRLRPSMYAGMLGNDVLTRMVEETFCLAAAEVSVDRPRINVSVTVMRDDDEWVIIDDDGPGACTELVTPSAKMKTEILMTELFACRDMKFDHESSSFCKMGLVVVNALSSFCWLEVKHDDTHAWVHLYRKGKLQTLVKTSSKYGPKSPTGNRFMFKPDSSILGKHSFDVDAIQKSAKNAELEIPGLRISVKERFR